MKKLILITVSSVIADNNLPNLIFTGIGGSCNYSLQAQLTFDVGRDTGQPTKCLEIGPGKPKFVNANSILNDFTYQAEYACQKVLADPMFKDT